MAPDYKALQDSLSSVMKGIEAENSKLMKNYDILKMKLEALTLEAQKVAAAVPAKKEVVKTEVAALLATVKTDLGATKALLAEAPKAVVEQIRNESKGGGAQVSSIENSLSGEVNYAEVWDRLNTILKSVSDINTELAEAIAKNKRR